MEKGKGYEGISGPRDTSGIAWEVRIYLLHQCLITAKLFLIGVFLYRGCSNVSTALITRGTLRPGAHMVAGTVYGKVLCHDKPTSAGQAGNARIFDVMWPGVRELQSLRETVQFVISVPHTSFSCLALRCCTRLQYTMGNINNIY